MNSLTDLDSHIIVNWLQFRTDHLQQLFALFRKVCSRQKCRANLISCYWEVFLYRESFIPVLRRVHVVTLLQNYWDSESYSIRRYLSNTKYLLLEKQWEFSKRFFIWLKFSGISFLKKIRKEILMKFYWKFFKRLKGFKKNSLFN